MKPYREPASRPEETRPSLRHLFAHAFRLNHGDIEVFWEGEHLRVQFRCLCGEVTSGPCCAFSCPCLKGRGIA